MSSTSANCCQLIPQDRATVFPALGQLAAAELTHHSLKPLRLPYSSRLRLSLLLAGDVHPNPGPATQYPCAECTSNVTSRGVSFKCNQCSGWVHSKCSGLQNAAQYRETKDWACSSCNSPSSPISTSSASTPYTNNNYQQCPFHYPTMERKRNRQQDQWTWYLHGEAQGQGGSDSGIKALSDVKCPLHPELHHSQKGPSSWPKRWFTHLCT